MKRSSLFAVVAALALLVGALLWFLGRGSPAPADAVAPETAAVGDSAAAPSPLAPDHASPERDAVAAEAPPIERASVVPIATADEEGKLVGRVVDSRGGAVAGAEVVAYLRPIEAREYLLDRAYRAEKTKAGATRTDEKGAFGFDLPTGRPHELRASAPGFAEAVVEGAVVGISVTITLHGAAAIEGTVTRKPDGTPIVGARVVVLGGDEPAWEGKTDASGHFGATGLDAGDVLLQVIPDDAAALTRSLELKEGEHLVQNVALETGFVVTGQVRDAVTGAPIEGAEVSSWSFYAKTVRTDASGRYTLAGLRGTGPTLEARAPGHGRYEQPVQPVEGEIVQADFELAQTRSARGRLIARDGSPVAGAYVAAYAHAYDKEMKLAREDLVSARSDADGKFELRDLRPDLPHFLFARKIRHASLIQRMPEVETAVVELGDVVLAPGATLSGVVLDSGRQPQEGVHVWIRPQDVRAAEAAVLDVRSAATDARGRFLFKDLAAGDHFLRFVKEGMPVPSESKVRLAEGEARSDLTIVLGEGMTLEGRVVDDHGAGVDGAQVGLEPEWKDGPRITAVTSADDGTFSFTGLASGAYTLNANPPSVVSSDEPHAQFASKVIENVSPGGRPITVQLPLAASVAGFVRATDGSGIAHAWVYAYDDRGRPTAITKTAPDGAFRVVVAADATIELRAWMNRLDTAVPPFATKSGVRAGETGVVLSAKP